MRSGDARLTERNPIAARSDDHRVRGWLLRIGSLLIGVVLVVVAVALSGTVVPSEARSRPLVVAPRPGQRVTSYPMTIRVRAADGLRDLRVWLNGRGIGSQFGPTRRGVRSLEVSISQGLKRGSNLLRVWVSKPGGGWTKRTVRFTLVESGPLAGAGPDVHAVVGEPVTLAGAAVPGVARHPTRAFTASAPRMRWTLISRPRNSGPPSLSARRGRTLRFVPRVPGPYTFRLTSRDAHGSTSDTATVDVVPPSPLVRVETQAEQGGVPGIFVGKTFYKEKTEFVYGGYAYWQVLVLDRATLGLIWNKTYVCPEGPVPCDNGGYIEKDLGKLDDTRLVIAALHKAPDHMTFETDLSEFGRIGAPNLDGKLIPFGYGSLIGVPGLPEGHAFSRLIPDDHRASGDMVGYLTPDRYFNYTFLPRDRVQFDTRATPTAGNDNAIQVGATPYQASLNGVSGGYHVVALGGYTLALRAGSFFQTGQSDGAAATAAVKQMKDFLNTKVRPGDLVFVDALTQPGKTPLNSGADPSALRDLASAVASVGGTMNLFNRSGITANSKYSLIGWGAAGEGGGQETSTVKDPVPGDGRLRGVLTPERDSLFKPTTSSAFSAPPQALANLILKTPGSWPLDGNRGAQKAIAYIGSQDKRLGADPRAAYWLQPFDQATWDQIAGLVTNLKYPGDGHGFNQTEFKAAQKELAQEMTWVGDVRAYLKNLSSPFGKGLSSWLDLTTITDKVTAALKPPNQRTTMLVLDIIGGVLSISGVAGGPAAEAIAVVYEVGLEYLAQDPGGGNEDTVEGNASELAAGLVSRLQDAQASFRNIGNILVGDYAKLKTAGTLGGCSPSSQGCPTEWQFTTRDQQAASAAAAKGIESEFDQRLMGLAFPAWLLGPRVVHHHNGHVTTNARDYPCGADIYYPFRNEPDNGQVALLQELPDLYDVLALANLGNLSFTNYIPNVPPSMVLNRMFSPLSASLDPKAGGLGIYAPDLMRAITKDDYNHVDKPGLPFVCGGGGSTDWSNR
jgi:hypothetical protein